MAASTPLLCAPVLSQKQRKAAQRKERRKRKRQAVAQARECGLKAGDAPGEEEEVMNDAHEDDEEEEEEEDDRAVEERSRQHAQWLERERLAQEEFRLKAEREEAAQRRKDEEERMIKEEWEAQQRREREQREQKQQEKRDREQATVPLLYHTQSSFSSHSEDEAVQKLLDEAENQLDNGGAWMNPEAPVTEKSENFGTECDVNNCPFFLKTGACRFGDRCSRKHIYPTSSPTLMIRGMFRTFGMEESQRDDYDIDACLEHSEEELYESFVEFYHDVLPEFRSVGKVVQFKISCNYEPHLRGNVYIQFDTEEQCKEAFIKFNGRWYAGRQLHCEMCPVTRWKNAICGLFDRRKCPKGKHCNFLHVFRNPGNEFWEADRDWHLSPSRSVRGSRRDGWYSERYRERSWRQRHSSRSPPRSERSHNRRRSRSRERRDREESWSSGWRHSDRRKDVSRGRDRSRSRSRDREQDRLRHRSRDADREHRYRNRSEERDGRDKDGDAHRETRERSRSRSTERRRSKDSRERSPKKSDRKTPGDDSNTHRRHKHSKKNKKKSKKKHKKKRQVTEGTTSSDESEKEKTEEKQQEEEEEETGNCSAVTETILKTSDVDLSVEAETRSSSPQGQSEQSNTETSTLT